MGRNINQARIESQEASELRQLLVSLHLNVTEANRLMKEARRQIPANQYAALRDKALELESYYKEEKAGRRPKIDNYRSYSLKSLRDFIQEQSFAPAEELHFAATTEQQAPADAYDDMETF